MTFGPLGLIVSVHNTMGQIGGHSLELPTLFSFDENCETNDAHAIL